MALDLPEGARDALAKVSEELGPRLKGARLVPPENLHVTLCFLGSVEDERAREIADAVGACAAGLVHATARLAGLGAFPSQRRARIVWAGLVDAAGATAAAADAVGEGLAQLGFPREDRRFHAHVTLARLRDPRRVDLEGVEVPPVAVPVDRLTLFRSHLGSTGARYEAVAVFPLP